MSERITAANLDEVVQQNKRISGEIDELVRDAFDRSDYRQVPAPAQLAFQILKTAGLIQMPIDNPYWSGAIYVQNGIRIPVVNTARPRANQYFTAWHEIYHLFYDDISFDHVIETDSIMEERKAENFASQMLLGNVIPFFTNLQNMDLVSKVFCCMDAFQAPYKAVLISLYENAVRTGRSSLQDQIKEIFDTQYNDIGERFINLGLDDTLVRPSYVVNVVSLKTRINRAIMREPYLEHHKCNAEFLNKIVEEIQAIEKSGEKHG